MVAIDRFILLVRDLRRNERGMAVATALVAMTVAFTFASAAVVYSVNTQHGTVRDHNAKEAIAAADAGANVALMRMNQFSKAVSAATPCTGISGTTLVVAKAEADGWCPQLTGTVGTATYSYRVGPTSTACSVSTSCVVAVGTSNGVSRRIEVTLGTSTIGGAFSGAGVLGQEDITLENSANIRVGVGTNGSIHLTNNSSICGSIRHGVGKEVTFTNNSSQCSGYVQTEGNETLPPVSSFMPTDIATNNSDRRLVKCVSTDNPTECQFDSYTKSWASTTPWNATTRTIEPAQNSSLTLTGGDYFICRLVLGNNAHLIMGATATVRIFFDTPENCGAKAGSTWEPIVVQNNADITSSGYQPSAGKFSVPGLYVTGSTSIKSVIKFENNSGSNQFVLYAPNSELYFENNATYKGAIAGKKIKFSNNAKVEQDKGFEPPQLGGSTIFARQSYVECTGATASPPNASC
ncbi:MAG TPA: hypothetical protein VFX44_07615 [Solirubrobacterales bacterium]|nr:hypothetical protein [Solirubrobacterales bacterium]